MTMKIVKERATEKYVGFLDMETLRELFAVLGWEDISDSATRVVIEPAVMFDQKHIVASVKIETLKTGE